MSLCLSGMIRYVPRSQPIMPSQNADFHLIRLIMSAVFHVAVYQADLRKCICLMESMCLQAISYKWLARHFSVPANDAKRHLFEFAEKHRNKVASTYLVAGWTKGANSHHVVQLVDASAVADKRSKLEPVTSLHVYSVQPTAPKACQRPSPFTWPTFDSFIVMQETTTCNKPPWQEMPHHLPLTAHLACGMLFSLSELWWLRHCILLHRKRDLSCRGHRTS